MSDRITQKDLEYQVATINEITKSPAQPWNAETKKANIGNYHLSYAYGGVTLHRMVNEGGGVTTPLGSGYRTKRELYEKMHAFIAGLTH
jgi:hypothetical protein